MRVLWIGWLVLGVLGAGAVGSPADAAPPPQVRVTMTDGVTAPHLGDRLTYVVTLVDRGSTGLSGQLRMAAPPGLADITVDSGALVGRELTWSLDIPAGGTGTATFTATTVGPSTRLATTVCTYLDATGRPIACASDLDQVVLPATTTGPGLAIAGGIAATLVLLIGATIAVRRRRSRITAVPTVQTPEPERQTPARV